MGHVRCDKTHQPPILFDSVQHKHFLQTLKCGQEIGILEDRTAWFRVRTNKHVEGYISALYVSKAPSVVLDDLERASKAPMSTAARANARPGVPLSPVIGQPQCHEVERREVEPNEKCLVDSAGSYSLAVVDSKVHKTEVLERLARISDLNASECFDMDPGFAVSRDGKHHDVLLQHWCRYVRRIDLAGESTPELPPVWKGVLQNQQLRTLWVQCTIRVDSGGLPLPERSRVVAPVAVETGSNLYLVVDDHPDITKYYASVYHLGRRVIDAHRCEGDAKCSDRIMSKYLDEIRGVLEKDPIAASTLLEEATPLDQMQMARKYKKSLVLGEPYYECSQYSVRGWTNSGDQVFSRVEHIVLISVNINGSYQEADSRQQAAYEDAVTKSIDKGLVVACQRLGGELDKGVCVIR